MAEYEIWQDHELVAMVESDDAQQAAREALHYVGQYLQDGPVEVMRVVRVRCDPESLMALARGRSVSDEQPKAEDPEGLSPQGASATRESGGRP